MKKISYYAIIISFLLIVMVVVWYVICPSMIAMIAVWYGKYPSNLNSKFDVKRLASKLEMASMPYLPVKEYPLLGKFTNLWQIDFFCMEGGGATDDKLLALSNVRLPRLREILLLDSPGVTDKGLVALARIKSIQGMQLEGTSITDEGLKYIATNMSLRGVNVSSCSNVTAVGIRYLLDIPTIEDIGFSVKNMSDKDVKNLIDSFKAIKYCSIDDFDHKLDWDEIKAYGNRKGTRITIFKKNCSQQLRTGP